MKTTAILAAAVAALLAIGAAAVFSGLVTLDAEPVWRLTPSDPAVVARGAETYAEACASCHGADLAGEADWRERKPDGRLPAPPHDASGHTWHHPDRVLFELTKLGPAALIGDPTYVSDMPAFEGVLSDADIVAALSYIKSRWPEAVARQHDSITEMAERP